MERLDKDKHPSLFHPEHHKEKKFYKTATKSRMLEQDLKTKK